ncbi:MAG: hypothetical protein J6V44_16595 [Methanobrevibacter sp.]|nr:hypothetical protein [Methanobrevibacter sp.]MBO7691978.1 hypothetical protein [Methanobrevibacter sp.]
MKPEFTLTIEYRSKLDGLLYLQFDADKHQPNSKVELYCHDDPLGRHDRSVTESDLKENYIKLREYLED